MTIHTLRKRLVIKDNSGVWFTVVRVERKRKRVTIRPFLNGKAFSVSEEDLSEYVKA